MARQAFSNAVLADVPPHAPVLVGVSGGRDSVALLHWLCATGFSRVVVCHLDHGLRTAGRADAKFVRALAAQLGCAVECGRRDVTALAKRRKISIETAAREARYAFFARCAKKHGTHNLVLAHHADDQVETFLFNLLRGAGPGGLGGMAAVSKREDGLTVVRPLLGVWREEIDAYVAAHALEFCEDGSNADPRHTRNRVRHDVLPALAQAMGRDVRRALWRTAEILRAEDEVVARLMPAGTRELPLESLAALPLAMRRRLVHAWLRAGGVGDVGFEEVEAVLSLPGSRRAKVNLPGGRHARRNRKRIFLE